MGDVYTWYQGDAPGIVTRLAYSMRSVVYCIHTLMAALQESIRITSLFLPPSDGPMMKSGTPTEVFIVAATR